MKRALLFVSVVFFVSNSLLAQKMNAVKTDLFSPILRTGVLKYERAFTDDISVQVGFFYTGYKPRDTETTLKGWGITPEFRFYFSETPAPNGTYLAPNIRYYNFTATDPIDVAEATITNVSLAINLGKQVILKDVFLIDAWVGPSYNFRSVGDVSGDIDVGITTANGFGLRIGLAIGLVF